MGLKQMYFVAGGWEELCDSPIQPCFCGLNYVSIIIFCSPRMFLVFLFSQRFSLHTPQTWFLIKFLSGVVISRIDFLFQRIKVQRWCEYFYLAKSH